MNLAPAYFRWLFYPCFSWVLLRGIKIRNVKVCIDCSGLMLLHQLSNSFTERCFDGISAGCLILQEELISRKLLVRPLAFLSVFLVIVIFEYTP